MTLRNHNNAYQRLAHAVLDRVRSGDASVTERQIVWALLALGEPVE